MSAGFPVLGLGYPDTGATLEAFLDEVSVDSIDGYSVDANEISNPSDSGTSDAGSVHRTDAGESTRAHAAAAGGDDMVLSPITPLQPPTGWRRLTPSVIYPGIEALAQPSGHIEPARDTSQCRPASRREQMLADAAFDTPLGDGRRHAPLHAPTGEQAQRLRWKGTLPQQAQPSQGKPAPWGPSAAPDYPVAEPSKPMRRLADSLDSSGPEGLRRHSMQRQPGMAQGRAGSPRSARRAWAAWLPLPGTRGSGAGSSSGGTEGAAESEHGPGVGQARGEGEGEGEAEGPSATADDSRLPAGYVARISRAAGRRRAGWEARCTALGMQVGVSEMDRAKGGQASGCGGADKGTRTGYGKGARAGKRKAGRGAADARWSAAGASGRDFGRRSRSVGASTRRQGSNRRRGEIASSGRQDAANTLGYEGHSGVEGVDLPGGMSGPSHARRASLSERPTHGGNEGASWGTRRSLLAPTSSDGERLQGAGAGSSRPRGKGRRKSWPRGSTRDGWARAQAERPAAPVPPSYRSAAGHPASLLARNAHRLGTVTSQPSRPRRHTSGRPVALPALLGQGGETRAHGRRELCAGLSRGLPSSSEAVLEACTPSREESTAASRMLRATQAGDQPYTTLSSALRTTSAVTASDLLEAIPHLSQLSSRRCASACNRLLAKAVASATGAQDMAISPSEPILPARGSFSDVVRRAASSPSIRSLLRAHDGRAQLEAWLAKRLRCRGVVAPGGPDRRPSSRQHQQCCDTVDRAWAHLLSTESTFHPASDVNPCTVWWQQRCAAGLAYAFHAVVLAVSTHVGATSTRLYLPNPGAFASAVRIVAVAAIRRHARGAALHWMRDAARVVRMGARRSALAAWRRGYYAKAALRREQSRVARVAAAQERRLQAQGHGTGHAGGSDLPADGDGPPGAGGGRIEDGSASPNGAQGPVSGDALGRLFRSLRAQTQALDPPEDSSIAYARTVAPHDGREQEVLDAAKRDASQPLMHAGAAAPASPWGDAIAGYGQALPSAAWSSPPDAVQVALAPVAAHMRSWGAGTGSDLQSGSSKPPQGLGSPFLAGRARAPQAVLSSLRDQHGAGNYVPPMSTHVKFAIADAARARVRHDSDRMAASARQQQAEVAAAALPCSSGEGADGIAAAARHAGPVAVWQGTRFRAAMLASLDAACRQRACLFALAGEAQVRCIALRGAVAASRLRSALTQAAAMCVMAHGVVVRRAKVAAANQLQAAAIVSLAGMVVRAWHQDSMASRRAQRYEMLAAVSGRRLVLGRALRGLRAVLLARKAARVACRSATMWRDGFVRARCFMGWKAAAARSGMIAARLGRRVGPTSSRSPPVLVAQLSDPSEALGGSVGLGSEEHGAEGGAGTDVGKGASSSDDAATAAGSEVELGMSSGAEATDSQQAEDAAEPRLVTRTRGSTQSEGEMVSLFSTLDKHAGRAMGRRKRMPRAPHSHSACLSLRHTGLRAECADLVRQAHQLLARGERSLWALKGAGVAGRLMSTVTAALDVSLDWSQRQAALRARLSMGLTPYVPRQHAVGHAQDRAQRGARAALATAGPWFDARLRQMCAAAATLTGDKDEEEERSTTLWMQWAVAAAPRRDPTGRARSLQASGSDTGLLQTGAPPPSLRGRRCVRAALGLPEDYAAGPAGGTGVSRWRSFWLSGRVRGTRARRWGLVRGVHPRWHRVLVECFGLEAVVQGMEATRQRGARLEDASPGAMGFDTWGYNVAGGSLQGAAARVLRVLEGHDVEVGGSSVSWSGDERGTCVPYLPAVVRVHRFGGGFPLGRMGAAMLAGGRAVEAAWREQARVVLSAGIGGGEVEAGMVEDRDLDANESHVSIQHPPGESRDWASLLGLTQTMGPVSGERAALVRRLRQVCAIDYLHPIAVLARAAEERDASQRAFKGLRQVVEVRRLARRMGRTNRLVALRRSFSLLRWYKRRIRTAVRAAREHTRHMLLGVWALRRMRVNAEGYRRAAWARARRVFTKHHCKPAVRRWKEWAAGRAATRQLREAVGQYSGAARAAAAVARWRQRVQRTIALRRAGEAAFTIGKGRVAGQCVAAWRSKLRKRLLLKRVLEGWAGRSRLWLEEQGRAADRSVELAHAVLSRWRRWAAEERERGRASALEETAGAYHRAWALLGAVRDWRLAVATRKVGEARRRGRAARALRVWAVRTRQRQAKIELFRRHFGEERPMLRALHALQRHAAVRRGGRHAKLRKVLRAWFAAAADGASSEWERRTAVGMEACRRVMGSIGGGSGGSGVEDVPDGGKENEGRAMQEGAGSGSRSGPGSAGPGIRRMPSAATLIGALQRIRSGFHAARSVSFAGPGAGSQGSGATSLGPWVDELEVVEESGSEGSSAESMGGRGQRERASSTRQNAAGVLVHGAKSMRGPPRGHGASRPPLHARSMGGRSMGRMGGGARVGRHSFRSTAGSSAGAAGTAAAAAAVPQSALVRGRMIRASSGMSFRLGASPGNPLGRAPSSATIDMEMGGSSASGFGHYTAGLGAWRGRPRSSTGMSDEGGPGHGQFGKAPESGSGHEEHSGTSREVGAASLGWGARKGHSASARSMGSARGSVAHMQWSGRQRAARSFRSRLQSIDEEAESELNVSLSGGSMRSRSRHGGVGDSNRSAVSIESVSVISAGGVTAALRPGAKGTGSIRSRAGHSGVAAPMRRALTQGGVGDSSGSGSSGYFPAAPGDEARPGAGHAASRGSRFAGGKSGRGSAPPTRPGSWVEESGGDAGDVGDAGKTSAQHGQRGYGEPGEGTDPRGFAPTSGSIEHNPWGSTSGPDPGRYGPGTEPDDQGSRSSGLAPGPAPAPDLAEQAAAAWDALRTCRSAFRAWKYAASQAADRRKSVEEHAVQRGETRMGRHVLRAWVLLHRARRMARRRRCLGPLRTWRAVAEIEALQRRRYQLAVEFRRRQLSSGRTTIRGETDSRDDAAQHLQGRGARLRRGLARMYHTVRGEVDGAAEGEGQRARREAVERAMRRADETSRAAAAVRALAGAYGGMQQEDEIGLHSVDDAAAMARGQTGGSTTARGAAVQGHVKEAAPWESSIGGRVRALGALHDDAGRGSPAVDAARRVHRGGPSFEFRPLPVTVTVGVGIEQVGKDGGMDGTETGSNLFARGSSATVHEARVRQRRASAARWSSQRGPSQRGPSQGGPSQRSRSAPRGRGRDPLAPRPRSAQVGDAIDGRARRPLAPGARASSLSTRTGGWTLAEGIGGMNGGTVDSGVSLGLGGDRSGSGGLFPGRSAAGSVLAVRGRGARGTLALTAQEFAGVQAGIRSWRERELAAKRALLLEAKVQRSSRLSLLRRCMQSWKQRAAHGRRRLVSRFLIEGIEAFDPNVGGGARRGGEHVSKARPQRTRAGAGAGAGVGVAVGRRLDGGLGARAGVGVGALQLGRPRGVGGALGAPAAAADPNVGGEGIAWVYASQAAGCHFPLG